MRFDGVTAHATLMSSLTYDRRGDVVKGNRVDRLCRWPFPPGYAVALALSVYFFVRC
ncbi:MAG: hypothetical protein Q8W45_07965 [Candidatus Palauibacterales bacterium]|nr:hypothetical protein [Candidatus Palauibacterales bacterium]MDP2483201.1 hypothetical protein [Candidatus Palauibacterales bacterium]